MTPKTAVSCCIYWDSRSGVILWWPSAQVQAFVLQQTEFLTKCLIYLLQAGCHLGLLRGGIVEEVRLRSLRTRASKFTNAGVCGMGAHHEARCILVSTHLLDYVKGTTSVWLAHLLERHPTSRMKPPTMQLNQRQVAQVSAPKRGLAHAQQGIPDCTTHHKSADLGKVGVVYGPKATQTFRI